MDWKEHKYQKKMKRAALRKLILEGQKLEQDIRFAKAEEKRKVVEEKRKAAEEKRKTAEEKRKDAQELREQENQQMKRQEERRKESADMREELSTWLKSLVPTLVGLMTSLRFSASVSNWVEAVLFYGLITLCVASTVVITTRLAVVFVKRLSKN